MERVTVTLPESIVEDIDRQERNRSRFILEAVRRELKRRRRELLRRSLASPHRESNVLADAGFDEWAGRLPTDEVSGIVDPRGGVRVRWVVGQGWSGKAG
jgi:Arc/MetJ-type ribon-helix-helix transcriptional regulator